MGIDLMSLYARGDRGFLIAMAREPLADGRTLVGYYMLARQ